MSDKREQRVDDGLDRGRAFQFSVDGETVTAYPGESIAAAMLAAGRAAARRTAKRREPRGYHCGMGVCWDCVMVVDGVTDTRTCRTEAKPGMRVETQHGVGQRT
ncbi:MAG: (2Fe-2S)-binding protein [Alphaproteobacteria bacterium]|nr:(2Fe-2S)-binding protein [Alphaproteobacteria bacterium]